MIGHPDEGEPADELTVEPVPVRTSDGRTRRRLRIAVALTLVAAIGVLGALEASRLLADLDPDGRSAATQPRLAIVEVGGGLATLNADGSAAVRYDAVGVVDLQFPAWSPDGSRIAAPGRAADGTTSLYVFDASGEPDPGESPPPGAITGPSATTLYTSRTRPPFYVSWSPDGRRIGFLTAERDRIALRVVPADGSGEETIVREGEPLYWDWIDADRLLVHVGAEPTEAFVGEVSLDGGTDASEGASEGASEAAPGSFRPPVVGRDGRFRAYVVAAEPDAAGPDEAGAATIVIEGADRSRRREIPTTGFVALSFDPAGGILAYTASGPPGARPAGLPVGPLHLVDAETGRERTLTVEPVIAFFWAPDGRTIATLRLRAPGEPGVEVATAGDPADPLPALAVGQPGVSFRLTFRDVASGEVRAERDVELSELYAFQVVPYFDQYALSHRTWAPDGSGIALPLVDAAGRPRVMVVPADGSDPRHVADGLIGFWRP
ncbi:MAG TPA: hypothetical protein VFO78_11255 [Candidatus Limnocylindrales bacterium]|nr:hypothetical protein [Candidatus Limnocylindrales bacterium]